MHTKTRDVMLLSDSDSQHCFSAAVFIFLIQVVFIIMIGMCFSTPAFTVVPPANVLILAARFVCCILMHLKTETDVRHGMIMMKFVIAHSDEFMMPKLAYVVGLMQVLGGLAAEIACIIFVSTINDTIFVIVRFIALSTIADIDDFYYTALPVEHKVKKFERERNLKENNLKVTTRNLNAAEKALKVEEKEWEKINQQFD